MWRGEARELRRVVLVDIDGVLSDASRRQHFLKNPEGIRDWEGFFGSVGEDEPLRAVPALVHLLGPDVLVVLLSGRPAWVADITRDWLERHEMRWDAIVLREGDDVMDPVGFKRDAVRSLRSCGYEVVFAFDDNAGICEMYAEEGVPALYVHSGYYTARV